MGKVLSQVPEGAKEVCKHCSTALPLLFLLMSILISPLLSSPSLPHLISSHLPKQSIIRIKKTFLFLLKSLLRRTFLIILSRYHFSFYSWICIYCAQTPLIWPNTISQAVRAYTKALKISPSNSSAGASLADVLLGLGRLDEAIKWWVGQHTQYYILNSCSPIQNILYSSILTESVYINPK